MLNQKILENLEKVKTRSKWQVAVLQDAIDLVSDCEIELNSENFEETLLNGAKNWNEYSWGGSHFVYDYDIAKRYCTDSEFKKKKEGMLRPNKNEEWLDVQARALHQAFVLIKKAIKQ